VGVVLADGALIGEEASQDPLPDLFSFVDAAGGGLNELNGWFEEGTTSATIEEGHLSARPVSSA
jgi:hypothetical protein